MEPKIMSAPTLCRFSSYALRSFNRDFKCKWGGAIPILMNFWDGISFLAFITVFISAIVSPTYAMGIFDSPILSPISFFDKLIKP